MDRYFLDFEQPIMELQAKIKELRMVGSDTEVNLSQEIARLEKQSDELTQSIFAKLTSWQITQMARHPLRPHTRDYIEYIFTEFDELHGDRHCSEAPSIIGGVARFDEQPVVVFGHQKGEKTKEKIYRNFGMARPEAYRKALRLMELAEKFSLPVFTFIDTPGAYPGIGAEERNQSEAIARNLAAMSQLRTPTICTVIGEGGSGGALAIGVGDRLFMLQYSIFSVISPEGCASILWKNADKAADAAEAMKITAEHINQLGLIDAIIKEPLGGAHRNIEQMFGTLKETLRTALEELQQMPLDILLKNRDKRLMAIGRESN